MLADWVWVQIMWVEVKGNYAQGFKRRWINNRHIISSLHRNPANIAARTRTHIRQTVEYSFTKRLHQFQTVKRAHQNKGIATSRKGAFCVFNSLHRIFKSVQSNQLFTNFSESFCGLFSVFVVADPTGTGVGNED